MPLSHNIVAFIGTVLLYCTGEYGFLQEMRRTNVAMTRARRHLVLIGDSTTISNEPFIKGMVAYCHKHGDVHSAYEYVNGML